MTRERIGSHLRSRTLTTAALALGLGIVAGWGLAPRLGTAPVLLAGGTDRAGESILTTGRISKTGGNSPQSGPQFEQHALYYLEYRTGRLLATLPTPKVSNRSSQLLSGFAERDLVQDFRLTPGTTPRFLMTTAGVGDGPEPLFVCETTTGQMACYLLEFQMTGNASRPKFQLLEIKAIGRPTPPTAN